MQQTGNGHHLYAKMAGLHTDGGEPAIKRRGFDLADVKGPSSSRISVLSESTFVKCVLCVPGPVAGTLIHRLNEFSQQPWE